MIEITNLTEDTRAKGFGFAVGRNKDESAVVEVVEAGQTKRLNIKADRADVVALANAGLISVKQVREAAPKPKPE